MTESAVKRRDDGRLARGRQRMREISIEAEAERKAEAMALEAALGHVPNAVERSVIEQISARTVRGRQLRRNGRDDTEQSRVIAQLLRSIGLKPAPAASQKPSATPGLDYLRETYGTEGAR